MQPPPSAPPPAGCARHASTAVSALTVLVLLWVAITLLLVCEWRGFCFAEAVNGRQAYSLPASNGFVPTGLVIVLILAPLSSCGAGLRRLGLAAAVAIVDIVAAVLLFVAGVGSLAAVANAASVSASVWNQLSASARALTYGGNKAALESEVRGDMVAVGASAVAGACLLALLGAALAVLVAQHWAAQRRAVEAGAAARVTCWGVSPAHAATWVSGPLAARSPLSRRPFGAVAEAADASGKAKGDADAAASSLEALPPGHPDRPPAPGAHEPTLSTAIVTCACCPGGGPCSMAVADVVSACCCPSVCPCLFYTLQPQQPQGRQLAPPQVQVQQHGIAQGAHQQQPQQAPVYGQAQQASPVYGQPQQQALLPVYGQPQQQQQAPVYGQQQQAPVYGQPQQQPVYGQPQQAPVYGQPQQALPVYGQPQQQASVYGQQQQAPVYGQPQQAPVYGQHAPMYR